MLSCNKEPQKVSVTGITMNPTSLSLMEGESQNLIATVSPSNADNKTVIWTSSDGSVASVNNGTVAALKPGSATISAITDDGGYTATCLLTVLPQIVDVTSITLNKAELSLFNGDTETLLATVLPNNATDKTVVWSSSDNSIATVSSEGLVTALQTGAVTITASCGGKSATCTVTVSEKTVEVLAVVLDVTQKEIEESSTLQLTATVLPEEATEKTVTWDSSDNSIATVSNTGLVTSLKPGNVTITASCSGKSATCEITVCEKIISVTGVSVSPKSLSLTEGGTTNLLATVLPENATNKEVTWTSSNAAVATVNSDGKVTAVRSGTATITVKTKDGGMTATCSIVVSAEVIHVTKLTLNRTSISLLKGENFSLEATVSPSNATFGTIIWSSNATSIATVDGSGKVTALSAGTAVITATADGKSASCQVTVTDTVNGGNEGTGETEWD